MKKILAADIGGTNSRFGYFQVDTAGRLSLIESRWIKTGTTTSFSHLLSLLKKTNFPLPPDDSDIAVLAVAGPVVEGTYSNPPHIAWDIDVSNSAEDYNMKRSLLINDFVAQAFACRSPVIKSAQKVVPGQIDPNAALAVIGPGTALGMAALLPDGPGKYVAVPSEGGHCELPFESRIEYEFCKFLLTALGGSYVEVESVVSGKGLSLIHQFLTGKKMTPAEVSAHLLPDSETLLWMVRFFARTCRNYALQVLARGGVYVTGGVAAKVPNIVTHPEFKKQFRSSMTMAPILKKIPVFLNTNEESGLWGSALLGMQNLKFEHRR